MVRTGLAVTIWLAPLWSAAGCSAPSAPEAEAPTAVAAAASPWVKPLLVVGIDGATLDRVLPLTAAGRLPQLERLMGAGSWGALETIEPTVSPAIWTTIATGTLPPTHGILGFEGVPGFSMTTLPTSQMRRVRAFWNVLSEHGRTVGVVGWWATWPAEPVEGYVVSDRAAYTRMEATLGEDRQEAHDVYPAELLPVVRSLVRPPEAISADEIVRFMELAPEEIAALRQGTRYAHGELLPEFKYVHQSDRSTADIALHLMASRPTDVTAVAFYGVDTVSHLAWHYMEPARFPAISIPPGDLRKFGGLIDRYYEFVDGMLGELVRAAGADANVVVFSDHGFGPTGQLPWSGGHGSITPGAPLAPDGLLVLAGPAIRAGVKLERAHVLDLAPMLLWLQGLPLAADMPGGVFREALQDDFKAAVPLREIPTYELGPRRRPEGAPAADPENDAATLERLKALGYVQ